MMIRDTRDMNSDELRSAYETAALIRNALDKSKSLEELRVYISDVMHEYTRLSLDGDVYFNNTKNYTGENLSILLREANQINEILEGELKELTNQINTGAYYHGY